MLLHRIKRFFAEYKDPRFRDRRGFYASELTKDMRDLYWSAIGEPETNPTDMIGSIRMLCGKAIERELTLKVLSNLNWFGLHLYNSTEGQISVGTTSPVVVDGSLDGLLVERNGDKFEKPWVLEIKTKYGYGADLFKQNPDPGESYLAQMGLYLKNLHEKGKTDRGMFLFVLLSDKSMGEMVELEAHYNADLEEVAVTKARFMEKDYQSDGAWSIREQDVDYRLALRPVFERLAILNGYVERGELPPAEGLYKDELTPDVIAGLSDYTLEKMIKGEKILGSWAIRYSRYMDLHLKHQNTTRTYDAKEMQMLTDEWQRRKPRSKKFKAG